MKAANLSIILSLIISTQILASTEPLSLAGGAKATKRLWEKPLGAHPSHVSVAANGQFILVSTSAPNQATLFSAKGKILWQKKMPQAVKTQAISADGTHSAICTYDSKMRVYDKGGRIVFENDGFGKPVFISATGKGDDRIALFNDDDSEIHNAFAIYDLRGKQIAKPVVESESVDFFVSQAKDALLILNSNNELRVYDTAGEFKWQATVGELVKTAVLEKKDAKVVYVLSDSVGAYDAEKKSFLWKTKLPAKFIGLHLIEDTLIAYSNTNDGQRVDAFSKKDGAKLWSKTYPGKANYWQALTANVKPAPSLVVPFEMVTPAGAVEFWGVLPSGNGLWRASVMAENGIFSYGVSESPKLLVVADGEPGKGKIEVFDVK